MLRYYGRQNPNDWSKEDIIDTVAFCPDPPVSFEDWVILVGGVNEEPQAQLTKEEIEKNNDIAMDRLEAVFAGIGKKGK